MNFPLTIEQLKNCEVEYKEFDGFKISGNEKTYKELDENARIYLEFIENFLNIPISIVSIGPKRTETIIIGDKHDF
jgi:adenylosuccinate synthase